MSAPRHVADRASGRPVAWLGAASFEERASTSLARLAEGTVIGETVLLEYPDEARQLEESRRRRAHVREVVENLATAQLPTRHVQLDPYSYYDVQTEIESYLKRNALGEVVIDISCLTKIQVIALSELLSRHKGRPVEIAYTQPDNYGDFGRSGPRGWRDVIVAPIAETARLFNEGGSRGIVVTGHERERLIAAMAEIEPSGGMILVADTSGRPDFRAVSEGRTRSITRHLLDTASGGWHSEVVPHEDWSRLAALVWDEISRAKSNDSPVILFPYGPKPFVFATALALSRWYRESSWFVYPIPVSYDVNYSEGQGETMWFYVP